jgi:hypothetical protein
MAFSFSTPTLCSPVIDPHTNAEFQNLSSKFFYFIAQIKKQLERNNQPLPFYTNDDSVSIGAVYLMADKIYPTAC